MSDKIYVLGPFPPPMHGFAEIMRQLAKSAEEFGEVERFDLSVQSSNKLLRHLASMARTLRFMFSLLFSSARHVRLVVIGVNGGVGLIYTIMLAFAARIAGLNTSLHHHSYGYVDRHSVLMTLLLKAAGSRAVHVFLSSSMERDFCKTYQTSCKAEVLPNAMFVPIPLPNPEAEDEGISDGRLCVGLLSNLSVEKGLLEFVETGRLLKAAQLPIRMLLAGPIARKEDLQLVHAAEKEGVLEWMGPLYGDEKAAFLKNLDLFLFPTRYRFEAQPTVIYEAFSNSIPVIAFSRGTITEQVGGCLLALEPGESFPERAVAECKALIGMSSAQRKEIKGRALARHEEDTKLGRETIFRLFEAREGTDRSSHEPV